MIGNNSVQAKRRRQITEMLAKKANHRADLLRSAAETVQDKQQKSSTA